MKPYRVVARLKNNRLWATILREWPNIRTQAAAAARLKCTASELGAMLNMRRWPGCKAMSHETCRATWCVGGWNPSAQKIAARLRETPEYLFDPELYGRRSNIVEVEIDRAGLESAGLLALTTGAEAVERAQLTQKLGELLDTLTPQEAGVIRARFGLNGREPETLIEIANDAGVSTQRISQVEAKALRKLRHPSRSKKLLEYL